MVCLDTTFIIDILKNNEKAIIIKERLEKSRDSIKIASPSIIEFIRGLNSIHVKKDEEERINNFINSVITLSLNKQSSIKAGYMELDLTRKGEMIDLEDIMIAAIAITNKEKLITKNEKHFRKIKELEIETY